MSSTAKRLPTTAHKNPNESIVVRLRKMLNDILNYHPNFLENIKNYSEHKVKLFNDNFLDGYILNNEDLLRKIFY